MAQYRTATGNITGDLSTTTALFAAVTGKTLSVRTLVINNSTTGAQTITIEKADGTNLIGPIAVDADDSIELGPFAPGSFKGDSGAAINALGSTSNVATVSGECYVL